MRRGFRTPLKHLSQAGEFASGNPRYYCGRKGTKRVPMPDQPWDNPEFLAAYAKALGGKVGLLRPAREGSLAAAISLYRSSDAFNALSDGTRYARRPILDAIVEKYGHSNVAGLAERHIDAALSDFSGHARNNRHKAWKHLCEWLKYTRRLGSNPMATLSKAPTPKSDGHIPWSAEDISAFKAYWPIGTKERLAFDLIFWTGARMCDAITLGIKNVDEDGWITFIQQKTDGEVSIPFNRDLPKFADGFAGDLESLKASIAAQEERHMTWMFTAHGASRSPKAASQWFAAKARKVGLVKRTAHGLRKSRSIALAEAGASSSQIGAWTGHESLREIERYTKKFDRRRALSRTNEEPKVPTEMIQFQNKEKSRA